MIQLNYKMRKIRNIVLLIMLLVCTKVVSAQYNALKLGLPGPFIGAYSLGVEQIIHSNHTVNVHVGYWNSSLGLLNVSNYFEEGKQLWVKSEGGGWHGSLEQRNYFSLNTKSDKQKFYWGPYFRFWHKQMVLNDNIQNDLVLQQQLFDVNTSIRGIGIGVQLGYHFTLTERLWIDFYFAGFGIERVKLKATYRAVDSSNFDYTFIEGDVRKAFDQQAGWIRRNSKLQSSTQTLLIELPATLPAFRAGINIAIKLD